jgi:hypothetical protein
MEVLLRWITGSERVALSRLYCRIVRLQPTITHTLTQQAPLSFAPMWDITAQYSSPGVTWVVVDQVCGAHPSNQHIHAQIELVSIH